MTNILYRTSTSTTPPVSTSVKGAALNNLEVDANFKSLSNDIDLKANITSPTLLGTPLAPTAAAGVSNTQIATTAFVSAERTNAATLTNKTLTAPTITNPDNTTIVLTDAVTTSWDMNAGHVARWVINASRTLATPTNYKTGGQYVLFLGNASPTTYVVTWPTIIAWPHGTAPDLTTSAWTVITLVWSIDHGKFLGSYTPGY